MQEKPTVLIVDDSAFMRNNLKELCQEINFQVIGEATDGIDAIEYFETLKPDILLLDITMPYKNGLEVMEDIIQNHPNAYIVVCSALGHKDKVMQAIKLGAKDYIVKPFENNTVKQVLKNYLLNS